YQFHYPCICDAKKAVQVAVHMQLASSLAVEEFRKSRVDGKIGIILNLTPAYCKNPENQEDQKAAYYSDLISNRSFLDPSVKGEYPVELVKLVKEEGIFPEISTKDLEIIRNYTVDYIGVNYYHPKRVCSRGKAWDGSWMPEKYYEDYVFEGQKMNKSRGWEIYEKAIYDVAINIRDHYGNIPWYISENGMGIQEEEKFIGEEGIVEDDYRIQFITDHLIWLHKAIEEGSNCFGYHLWTPFDCWSWTNAYKNRYGLIRVDVKDGCKLKNKKSGRWFKQLSESNILKKE
ncbi:MAG: glycoside hydrolase family 1 protein, partial [Hungatella sp.]